MKQYKHETYDDYVKSQVDTYNRKSQLVWVRDVELNAAVDVIKRRMKETKNIVEDGICHGVRTGYEMEYFNKRFKDSNVIGTEIARSDPEKGIYKMDFHELPYRWQFYFDFIYSNSFDHAYDPELALNEWMNTLTGYGVCIIHWMSTNEDAVTKSDCFAATRDEYRELFSKNYNIYDEIEPIKGRVMFCLTRRDNKIR